MLERTLYLPGLTVTPEKFNQCQTLTSGPQYGLLNLRSVGPLKLKIENILRKQNCAIFIFIQSNVVL
jgi:hypothetical protein